MNEYLLHARDALAGFDAAVEALSTASSQPPAAPWPVGFLARLGDILQRLRVATGRLRHSMDQIETTGLDIVDLQMRLEGEGAALAVPLKALGEMLQAAPDAAAALIADLCALEEAAERVAAAIFPNAIEGVADVNRTLWEVRPLWNEYARVLAREVTRTGSARLTADQLARVEQTAADIRGRFDAVNDLLNQLVVSSLGDEQTVKAVIRDSRQALMDAVRHAQSKASDPYRPFRAVLKRAEGLAGKVDQRLSQVRVPVFPAGGSLDAFAQVVAPALYQELAGVQRFALFNIAARLRSITFGPTDDEHLLAPAFAIRVFDVFPDRVYFTADAAFIQTIVSLASRRVFEKAPASLHRFNEGSYKQRQFRTGNLQVSFAMGSPDAPGDRTRVTVDADIDLYRSPVRHLFGEVLINHLTGSKTDQFKVWDTLTSSRVPPIAGFDVVSA